MPDIRVYRQIDEVVRRLNLLFAKQQESLKFEEWKRRVAGPYDDLEEVYRSEARANRYRRTAF